MLGQHVLHLPCPVEPSWGMLPAPGAAAHPQSGVWLVLVVVNYSTHRFPTSDGKPPLGVCSIIRLNLTSYLCPNSSKAADKHK